MTSKDIKAGNGPRQWHSLGELQPAVDAQVAALQKEEAGRRLWAKDSTLWSADPAKREEIRDRLGWLNVAEKMLEHAAQFPELEAHGKAYSDVVPPGIGPPTPSPHLLPNPPRLVNSPPPRPL